jgi:hypothetical protein
VCAASEAERKARVDIDFKRLPCRKILLEAGGAHARILSRIYRATDSGHDCIQYGLQIGQLFTSLGKSSAKVTPLCGKHNSGNLYLFVCLRSFFSLREIFTSRFYFYLF